MTPRQVQLPVCPVPGRPNIGKQPNGNFRSFCTGPSTEPHKRTRMILRTFEEIDRLDVETGEGRC